jgi:hypothetical protein
MKITIKTTKQKRDRAEGLLFMEYGKYLDELSPENIELEKKGKKFVYYSIIKMNKELEFFIKSL